MLQQSISSDCTTRSFPSSSSSSVSFSLLQTSNTSQKTMEEVWKDISITPLSNTTPFPHSIQTIHHPSPNSQFRGMILQDFFNGRGVETGTERRNPSIKSSSIVDSSPPPPNSTQIRPPTTQEFQFFEDELMNSQNFHHHQQQQQQKFQIQGNNSNSSVSELMGLNNSGVVIPAFDSSSSAFYGGVHRSIKKRFSNGDDDVDVSANRRHKRMIKNRESAARSRARKQAYITELELEVQHLAEENAKLKKQQRQLIGEVPVAQLPKKLGLYRTSTAPF